METMCKARIPDSKSIHGIDHQGKRQADTKIEIYASQVIANHTHELFVESMLVDKYCC